MWADMCPLNVELCSRGKNSVLDLTLKNVFLGVLSQEMPLLRYSVESGREV